MSHSKPTLDEICRYRKILQNPYACVEQKEEALALRLSENPWATLEHSDWVDESTSAIGAKTRQANAGPIKAMSKRVFVQACTKILRGYLPLHQRGLLLPQHQHFIFRNATRPSDVRARLVKALSKYDLSDQGHLRRHFNRELTDKLDEQKLSALESEALGVQS